MISLIRSITLLVILSVLYPAVSYADRTVRVQWISATEREDGTPLLIEEIAYVGVYYNDPEQGLILHREFELWGIKEGNPYMAWYETKPEPHCYTMTTVDTDGIESIMTPLFCMEYLTPGEPQVICQ